MIRETEKSQANGTVLLVQVRRPENQENMWFMFPSQSQLAQNRRRERKRLKGVIRRSSLFLPERSACFVLLRPTTDRMNPTHNQEDHLLTKSIESHVSLSQKDMHRCNQIMFDQTSGYPVARSS